MNYTRRWCLIDPVEKKLNVILNDVYKLFNGKLTQNGGKAFYITLHSLHHSNFCLIILDLSNLS